MKKFQSFVKKYALRQYHYSSDKVAMHRAAMGMLRELAAALGYAPDAYDVRSNKGGIAVTGEVTLHADNLYVQVCDAWGSNHLAFLVRTCKGRKDYCGGANHYLHPHITSFDDVVAFCKRITRNA
jgi:hypothetical protein